MSSTPLDEKMFGALRYRLVGPHRGGRVVAVAGDPVQSQTFYFGSTGGGVWKTEDGGLTWRNVSDGCFQTASVGAVAVAPSDPNVIYVGMGESTIRGNVAHGDGVYRSTDGGRTWRHLGLSDTRYIAKIRVHPTNPDIVYVAALGHIFGPGDERGVFRSLDGGKTWERVLFRSDRAGAIDVSLDPNNPRLLYAAIWDVYRTPYTLSSGGPESSIYRSVDGGATWQEITQHPGLPQGLKGKIGIAASPAKGGLVFAIVEAAAGGGLYRSEDYGATWRVATLDPEIQQRPWYYMHVIPDPRDADTVYIMNVQFWKSVDGGRSFSSIATPHGDNHDLWIDPLQPQRMITGNDGGANVSLNGGATWTSSYNQPTAEFYHVTTDNQFPYRLYGAQQDNSTISVPSRTDQSVISQASWYTVGGGESGYIAVRPDDPNVVYAGSYGGLVTRFDHRTGQVRDISVWPENCLGASAGDLTYRFQWTAPIVLSPHDPGVLYVAGNHVFRTSDEGQSWEMISPDLTRNDPSKLGPSGGPISKDQTSVEYYCTVFAFAESPVQQGVLWAGSDDGLIHVSHDRGKTWENVTPAAELLPEWALISIIEPSQHDAGTAYVAATRYKLDDNRPCLLRTRDFGKTWDAIAAGIPAHAFTRVVREDVVRKGLLFAGTEIGMYVSFDDGASWQPLQRNLPVVPIHDLQVKDNDLVVATHGRSFWILDNVGVLREFGPQVAAAAAHLFRPPVAYRLKAPFMRFFKDASARAYLGADALLATAEVQPDGSMQMLDAGENPPVGAVVTYYLQDKPEGEVKLGFYDARGSLIKEFSSKAPEPKDGLDGNGKTKEKPIPAEAGTNRFVWNMRYPDADDVPGNLLWRGSVAGPVAVPGTYQVRLTVGEQIYVQPLTIRKDPRLPVTQEGLQEQFDLLMKVRNQLDETHKAVNRLRDVREQVEAWAKRAGSTRVVAAADDLCQKLTAIEEQLWQPKSKTHEDPLNYPMQLNNKLATVGAVVATADARPTRQSYAVYEQLTARIDALLQQLQAILEDDVRAFAATVAEAGAPLIRVG